MKLQRYRHIFSFLPAYYLNREKKRMWVTGNHSFILTILLVNQISAKNNLMGREKVTPNNTKRTSVLGLSIQLN